MNKFIKKIIFQYNEIKNYYIEQDKKRTIELQKELEQQIMNDNYQLYVDLSNVRQRRHEPMDVIINKYEHINKSLLTQKQLLNLYLSLIHSHINSVGDFLNEWRNRDGRDLKELYPTLENLITYIEPQYMSDIVYTTKIVNDLYKNDIDVCERYEIDPLFINKLNHFYLNSQLSIKDEIDTNRCKI